MTRKINKQSQRTEIELIELNENDLEQVSGGFNPQPDPPYEGTFKFNQQLQRGPVVSLVEQVVQKIKK